MKKMTGCRSNQMNTIMSKIKTKPQKLGRLDPEWDKHRRNKYIEEAVYQTVVFIAIIILIFGFVAYKGFERKYKQDNLNKQQNYENI